jgi:uncharacterized protein YggE
MDSKQPPFIKVFGSAVLRVEPDLASIQFSVGRQAKQAKDAFREANQAAKSVRAYLSKANVGEVASSRVSLSQTYEYSSGRQHPTGYMARISFSFLLLDLDRIEELLTGVIEAGGNDIGAVEFRTSRLREHRAEARRSAVFAAREKAENYCRAAGVSLGTVRQIEDVHPESVRGSGEGNTSSSADLDDSAAPNKVLTPGSIIVTAAVRMVFSLASEAVDSEKAPIKNVGDVDV